MQSRFLLPVRHLAQIALGAAIALVATAQPAAAGPYAPYGSTPGETAAGAMLDAGAAASNGRSAMMNALDALPTAAARADALGQLSPRSYSLLPRLSIQSMDAADRDIRNWLTERRSIALDAPANIPATGRRTISMTLTGGVRQARYEGRTDRPEAKSDSRSLRFAIDVTPVKGLILGATLGIDGIDARLDPAQSPRITLFTTHIGPYVSYNNGKFYADATAGYSYSEYKLRRQIGWNGFTGRMVAPTDGDNWSATGEAGAMLRAGSVRVQPFAGLAYRYADISGFTEGGGSPAALEVARYRTQSLRGTLGARVQATVKSGRWAIRPLIEAQWQRELRSRPDSRIEARFASRDLPVFTLQPTRLARDAALVNAGVSASFNSRTAFRIGYAGEFSSDRHVNAAIVSLSRRF